MNELSCDVRFYFSVVIGLVHFPHYQKSTVRIEVNFNLLPTRGG